jgi:hypothetical protein
MTKRKSAAPVPAMMNFLPNDELKMLFIELIRGAAKGSPQKTRHSNDSPPATQRSSTDISAA